MISEGTVGLVTGAATGVTSTERPCDADVLQKICADNEEQAAVLGMPAAVQADPAAGVDLVVHYVPCPVCGELMNRVNFAKCSHVVVDVCRQHGTWFDQDELRRIVEFIRGGGLDRARAAQIQDLEDRERQLRAAQSAAPADPPMGSGTWDYTARHAGLSLVASALRSLLD